MILHTVGAEENAVQHVASQKSPDIIAMPLNAQSSLKTNAIAGAIAVGSAEVILCYETTASSRC